MRASGTQLNESSVYTSLLSLLLPQRRDALPHARVDVVGPNLARTVLDTLQVEDTGLLGEEASGLWHKIGTKFWAKEND